MGTTLDTLRGRVLLGFPRADGEAIVAIEQAINDSIQIFAQMEDFDEMLTKDTTSADTVDGTATYHLTSAWGLTRPKDILSMILEDTTDSVKLKYMPHREFDSKFPYPATYSEDRPTIYTRRGLTIELFRIPDAAYDVHITYSQFPAALTSGSAECTLLNFDTQIVFLAKDIASAYLSGNYTDFQTRAREILKVGMAQRRTKTDNTLMAKPFVAGSEPYLSEYYADPMVKEVS